MHVAFVLVDAAQDMHKLNVFDKHVVASTNEITKVCYL